MNEYLIVKLLHVIGFAYWLGGDLGVFLSSFSVVNDKLSSDARVTAAKILFQTDQGPRISMTMMLPLGTHLAWKLGVLPITGTIMTVIWFVCLAWLAMVITLHSMAAGSRKSILTTIDFYFRLLLSLGLIGFGLYSLLGPGELQYWVAAKFAIFGGLVGCGLIVRIKLKPFAAAFAKVVGNAASDEDNAEIRRHMSQIRPIIIVIYTGLIASAALGMHLI